MRFIHTADLHLGAGLNYLGDQAPIRQKEFIETFERIIARVADPAHRLELLVIAGDLFDVPRPPVDLVERFRSACARLNALGKKIVMVPGTHDGIETADSVYLKETFPGLILLKEARIEQPVTWEISGETVHFYGMGFNPARYTGPWDDFKRMPAAGIHIAVIHGSLEGSPAWDNRDRYLPLRRAPLAQSGMHYLALGHYHNFRAEKLEGKLTAAYPGSTEGRKFGEYGPRYILEVECTPDEVSLIKVPINTREIIAGELEINNVETEQIAAAARSRFPASSILRLVLKGITEERVDIDALRRLLQAHYFHLELVEAYSMFSSRYIEMLSQENTVRGLFVRRIQERYAQASPQEKSILELALRLGLANLEAK